MQDGLQPHHIRIPKVEPEYADPVASFIKMCRIVPANNNSPLFMLNPLQPLFVEQLRKTFRALCQEIGLDVQALSLHSLRRGGASEAYHKGASPLDIQRHGGWNSSTFWDYIYPSLSSPHSVCQALSR
ncbi:MAG: tyrosine-type recombinase/integrase [Desulfobulbaceae bacterium]|nr:tyrosine-type recombinase/integrase [Desulfobulbaceae bacterium]